ncbi:FAD-dependent oxidoreductase [Sporolactobacillus nakayamae]|uniref:NADPH-dependent 2,4-dienoyl-CoA reductase, sulfur reductase n=1 Tax=Sporolactobacillus nakayamae TaxID=269670 RepID=A0A1I2SAY3_9BACL|nr:FAD-dependent oxidoreductase [Sporolactobacillus nakayamae]SFG47196.1 NADPH-dependent 2,4-dienoyl-CoA reductase, sulfur reductase [Sporolactobacillus nakayamae]
MKYVIIGGVAGGMSAATRLRRLNEDAEIIVLERGPYVSFANCGLPYFIGGVIKERSKLLVQTAEKLYQRFRLDVRPENEVTHIDRKLKKVIINHHGKTYEETYDVLILSTGAHPMRPPIEGIDQADNLFTLRDVPDAEGIVQYLQQHKADRAVIVGAGFIGIEMAENLAERGLKVTIVEREHQVLPPLDPEMAIMIEAELKKHNIEVLKGKTVTSFEKKGAVLVLDDGTRKQTDLTLLSVGVVPESSLADHAGLALGIRRSISVNDQLQTSDPNIYAIGDAIEVAQTVGGRAAVIPLASPANRQGRMVADILSGMKRSYKGTLGTSIVKVFDWSAAVTGLSEKLLQRFNIPYEALHTSPPDHATYYPGSSQMTLKLLFDPETGKILGAQAVGEKGIDKTIDILATAIHGQMTVNDLTALELAYAPPFSSAKAPINLIGYAAENVMDGNVQNSQWNEVDQLVKQGAMLIDVRTEQEYGSGTIQGAVNIPLDDLRERVSEIPKDRDLIVTCQVGLRGYLAARILAQKGYSVKNLDGGYKLYKSVFAKKYSN